MPSARGPTSRNICLAYTHGGDKTVEALQRDTSGDEGGGTNPVVRTGSVWGDVICRQARQAGRLTGHRRQRL